MPRLYLPYISPDVFVADVSTRPVSPLYLPYLSPRLVADVILYLAYISNAKPNPMTRTLTNLTR